MQNNLPKTFVTVLNYFICYFLRNYIKTNVVKYIRFPQFCNN